MTERRMRGNRCNDVSFPNAEAYFLGLVLGDNLWFNPKTNTLYYHQEFACDRFVERNANVDNIRIDVMGTSRYQRVFFEYVDDVRGSYEDCAFKCNFVGAPMSVERVKAWIHAIKKTIGEENSCKTECFLCAQGQASSFDPRPSSHSARTNGRSLSPAQLIFLFCCVFVLSLVIVCLVVDRNSKSMEAALSRSDELHLASNRRLQLVEERLDLFFKQTEDFRENRSLQTDPTQAKENQENDKSKKERIEK